jgi:hypothetical protein
MGLGASKRCASIALCMPKRWQPLAISGGGRCCLSRRIGLCAGLIRAVGALLLIAWRKGAAIWVRALRAVSMHAPLLRQGL